MKKSMLGLLAIIMGEYRFPNHGRKTIMPLGTIQQAVEYSWLAKAISENDMQGFSKS
jgi:hypothetical protein